jgi:hypothetical protein
VQVRCWLLPVATMQGLFFHVIYFVVLFNENTNLLFAATQKKTIEGGLQKIFFLQ